MLIASHSSSSIGILLYLLGISHHSRTLAAAGPAAAVGAAVTEAAVGLGVGAGGATVVAVCSGTRPFL